VRTLIFSGFSYDAVPTVAIVCLVQRSDVVAWQMYLAHPRLYAFANRPLAVARVSWIYLKLGCCMSNTKWSRLHHQRGGGRYGPPLSFLWAGSGTLHLLHKVGAIFFK